ncbi:class I SAM-dependent methyltransferase [Bacillus manliponensis]|uniref:class I SAM-dependent methyltransferase n=1 Tax=Bacillus manliponensis TaxID=574376 RepID=UPI003517F1DB
MRDTMNRITRIRKEEKEYHEYCYENYKLFVEGSWLHKPVQTVMDVIPFLQEKHHVSILDLGCGIGRNSIPLANAVKEQNGTVICVDLLPSAIQKLEHYSKEYDVQDVIQPVLCDIADYDIKENSFDFIFAVSSLEHVASEGILENVLKQTAHGTKTGGINCFIINCGVEEFDLETGNRLEALMEVNIPVEDMLEKLKHIYRDWNTLNIIVKPLEYKITRNGRPVLLKTHAVTYVVRKEPLA